MSQHIKTRLSRMKARTQILIFVLCVTGLAWATFAAAEAIVGDPVLGADDPILGSKHDFTGLNDRAGVVAMSGVAFSDYGYSCVYCHIPPEEAGAIPADFGGIDGWNRYVPALSTYDLYDSVNLDNKTSGPNPISMLCLSCHDGTMAVDMVVFQPATTVMSHMTLLLRCWAPIYETITLSPCSMLVSTSPTLTSVHRTPQTVLKTVLNCITAK